MSKEPIPLVVWHDEYSIGPSRYLAHNGMFESPVQLGENHVASGLGLTREASMEDGIREAKRVQQLSWGS